MNDHDCRGRMVAGAMPPNIAIEANSRRKASHWSGADKMPHRPAPRLGEHSAEILREAGYSDGDIKTLAASGTTRIA